MLIQVLGHTLLGRESSASKRVSHSKILIQPKGYLSHSFFIFIFNLFKLGEFFLFLDALDSGFLGGVREVWTGICHISFPEALFSFLWGESFDFYYVDIHGIGVFSSSGGRRKGLEGLGRPSTSLNDLLSMVLLVLKMNGFQVPVVNFVWYCA